MENGLTALQIKNITVLGVREIRKLENSELR